MGLNELGTKSWSKLSVMLITDTCKRGGGILYI